MVCIWSFYICHNQHPIKGRFPNHDFKWKHIWNALPDCTKEARLISLNWKIIHNIYPTKLLLHKMGKAQSDICNICNSQNGASLRLL